MTEDERFCSWCRDHVAHKRASVCGDGCTCRCHPVKHSHAPKTITAETQWSVMFLWRDGKREYLNVDTHQQFYLTRRCFAHGLELCRDCRTLHEYVFRAYTLCFPETDPGYHGPLESYWELETHTYGFGDKPLRIRSMIVYLQEAERDAVAEFKARYGGTK